MRILLIALIPFLFIGCPGSRTLEEGGAYQSNMVLFNSDEIVKEYVNAVDLFVAWSDRNREFVRNDPSLTQFDTVAREQLDGIPEEDEPLVMYFRARDIYEATLHEVAKNDLENTLNVLTSLTIQILNAIE
ncbi:hypothetical protein N8Z76_00370 [Gammaproteobacteria bacterium]|nr:hypothetical protein [Gammaproteobacteria bacterium]